MINSSLGELADDAPYRRWIATREHPNSGSII
jgi:hypothetical protein